MLFLMCRSKCHVHKQTPSLCWISRGLRPCITFVVVRAGIKDSRHFSAKKCGVLSTNFWAPYVTFYFEDGLLHVSGEKKKNIYIYIVIGKVFGNQLIKRAIKNI
jgi:hypothetical protein